MEVRSLLKIANELCGMSAIMNKLSHGNNYPEEVERLFVTFEAQFERIADEVADWSEEWDGMMQQNKRIRKELDELKLERRKTA